MLKIRSKIWQQYLPFIYYMSVQSSKNLGESLELYCIDTVSYMLLLNYAWDLIWIIKIFNCSTVKVFYNTYIYIYIYIYIYYVYNHEKNVPCWLSPQWLCGILSYCFCEIWELFVSWITYDHLFILYIILFYILQFNMKGTSYQLGKKNFIKW